MPAQSWLVQPADPDLVRSLAGDLGCPFPIAHLLVARGINTPEAASTFFHPTSDDLHAPGLMLGVAEAVARVRYALHHSEPILIYGDYDVDGTTATVLLKTVIERVAPPDRPAHVTWHVPHRIREGYGMQSSRLAEAAAAGVRLVISVDTGIRAFAAATEARALGLDLIVTDHHLPDGETGLPDALAVVNPNQPGCPYPFKELCGAAVSFKLAHALLLDHAHESNEPEIQLDRLNRLLIPSLLKLVAVATIADSVPLTGENRALAYLGLKELANPVQPGLRALMRVSAIPTDRSPTANEVGFRIAPRINAAGRMDVADDVIELFLTRDPARATVLAEKLDNLNHERQQTEQDALTAIEQHLLTLIDPSGQYPTEVLVLDHPEWHRGVLGILASRVVDRTQRPALVLTHHDGQAHGSGRSIPGLHLLDALSSVHAVDCTRAEAGTLFTRFGGHAYAVGFSLPSSRVPVLRDRLRAHSAGLFSPSLIDAPLFFDAQVSEDLLTQELFTWIQRFAPFGNSNPEIVLLTPGLVLAAPVRRIGERHVSFDLASSPGAAALRAVGWSRKVDWSRRCEDLGLVTGSRIDLVYRLRSRSDRWFSGLELEMVGVRQAEF